jgi:hypothetical protein
MQHTDGIPNAEIGIAGNYQAHASLSQCKIKYISMFDVTYCATLS